MHPARFLLSRPARNLPHQRRETLQRRLHVIDGGELVQAVRARPQLAGGLRAAQKEQRDDGLRRAVELPRRVEIVVVSRGAPAEDFPHQLLILQTVERALKAFRGTREPFDDATMMAVRVG